MFLEEIVRLFDLFLLFALPLNGEGIAGDGDV